MTANNPSESAVPPNWVATRSSVSPAMIAYGTVTGPSGSRTTPGRTRAVPAAGAYCLAMASNYNGMPRPEVLMLRDGEARVMRRRETLDDLVAAEVF